jgi:DNA-binding MltR family transcriptional regulator
MFPFDYTEIKNLYIELINKLLVESGRGAILIATSYVDDFLTDLIVDVLPKEQSKSQRNRLLEYPGPLSSFSAKIELAYSFRLISQNLYNCLNALRKVRNNAAHSATSFELHELNEQMKEVYNVGETMPEIIKKFSTEMLIEVKLHGISPIINKLDITTEQKQKKIIELFEGKEGKAMIEKQLPFWELIHGICFICGMIIHQKKQISSLTNGINTWAGLAKSSVNLE